MSFLIGVVIAAILVAPIAGYAGYVYGGGEQVVIRECKQ